MRKFSLHFLRMHRREADMFLTSVSLLLHPLLDLLRWWCLQRHLPNVMPPPIVKVLFDILVTKIQLNLVATVTQLNCKPSDPPKAVELVLRCAYVIIRKTMDFTPVVNQNTELLYSLLRHSSF